MNNVLKEEDKIMFLYWKMQTSKSIGFSLNFYVFIIAGHLEFCFTLEINMFISQEMNIECEVMWGFSAAIVSQIKHEFRQTTYLHCIIPEYLDVVNT